MWIVFIIILVVVGLFAVWFNIWNHRNPVGGGKNKNKQTSFQSPKSSEQEWMDLIRKNREEHERKNGDKK